MSSIQPRCLQVVASFAWFHMHMHPRSYLFIVLSCSADCCIVPFHFFGAFFLGGCEGKRQIMEKEVTSTLPPSTKGSKIMKSPRMKRPPACIWYLSRLNFKYLSHIDIPSVAREHVLLNDRQSHNVMVRSFRIHLLW